MTATCSICGREPARPGLKTGAGCAARYAEARRERRRRLREQTARESGERPPAPRFTIEPARSRPGTPPEGFRVARGTRYAVDASGLRVVRKGPDREWHHVDLAAAPLVQRAMAALVARAWTR